MPVEFTPEADETPAERARKARWREVENALTYIGLAQFEYERDDFKAGRTWLDDARRALGALALLMSDDLAAVGYARLLDATLTPPRTDAEKAYIERNGRES